MYRQIWQKIKSVYIRLRKFAVMYLKSCDWVSRPSK